MATTAERLKEAMQLRKMKQVDIVDKTKISKGALSSYVSGSYEPKQENIYKLAKALNVNEAWLMGHDVSMQRDLALDKEEYYSNEGKKMRALENYLFTLGYEVARDDPEHPAMIWFGETYYRTSYAEFNQICDSIESYTKYIVDSIIKKG